MSSLLDIPSVSALADLIRSKTAVVVTFSAHWCGPCRASHPALQALATKVASSSSMAMGIVYEDVLGDATHSIYHIRAFPTHVLFVNGVESQRIEGANIPAVDAMIQTYLASSSSSMMMTGSGAVLGGNSALTLSPAAARLARLVKLGATTTTPTTSDNNNDDVTMNEPPLPTAMDIPKQQAHDSNNNNQDVEMVDPPPNSDDDPNTNTTTLAAEPSPVLVDPTATLNPEHLQTLTETMGFTLIRAQKGLLYGTGNTVEGAIEWLMEHQDDDDIDAAIPPPAAVVAQSYKCNECGKVLSNMANLELHANKTGHSDFEESTQCIQPLTAEEKIAKIAEIKQLLKLKRTEREEAEKVDDVEREIKRREMGKEMAKTKEQLDAEQRKRETMLRKKEKADFARERERLREELARDKAERASGKGKLSSRLGVDGYKPDGIQYDVGSTTTGDGHHPPPAAAATSATAVAGPTKKKGDPSKIDEYIEKVSSYRAGGDGGNCLRILMLYVGNVADNPSEEKYKTIKMDNKTYRTKVKPFIGAKDLLLACGFAPPEGGPGDVLVLPHDHMDVTLLTDTKTKLEAAYEAFNK